MNTQVSPYSAYNLQQKLHIPRFSKVLSSEWAETVGKPAMDRFIRLLPINIEGVIVGDFAHFESLHHEACAKLDYYRENFLACEEDEIATRSPTNFLASCLAKSQREKNYNWPDPQSFSDFLGGLDGQDKVAVYSLIKNLTGHECEDIIAPHEDSWNTPEIIDELADSIVIMGRQYMHIPGDKWLRADRYVQRYHVIEFRQIEHEDEDGYRVRDTWRTIGTAGTLAGAIEVAEKAVDNLQLFESDQKIPWGTPFPYRYKIIDTASDHPVLEASIESYSVPSERGFKITPYNEWETPLTPVECREVELKVEEIVRQITSDRHSKTGYDHLNSKLGALRDRLHAPDHSYEKLVDTLRETLHILKKERGLAALLEMDLGL
jgi:hypothetical protein